MKSKNSRQARIACILIGLVAIIAVSALVAHAAPGTPVKDRCILPWNCPNGHCPPHVDVTVVAPHQDEAPAPIFVPALVEPQPAPFPYGLLLAILVPVVLVASVIAFVIRVSTSRP